MASSLTNSGPASAASPSPAAALEAAPLSWWRRVANALEFIKFSHTVFALPFALVAMLVAAEGVPSLRVVVLVLTCMASARTAAMAFNRWADWDFDRRNPRTARRSQLATRGTAAAMVIVSLAVFVAATAWLNPLCLALSPVAAALVLGYSLTKRFTAYTHLFLGLALAAAPMGGWAAVTGSLLPPAPWLLAAAVLAWVFGFDLIYATQDVAFDRQAGLHSFPARFGVPAALRLSRWLHLGTIAALVAFGYAAGLGAGFAGAVGLSAAALAYEHILARHADLARLNVAFFHMNALVGLALLTGTLWDLGILRP